MRWDKMTPEEQKEEVRWIIELSSLACNARLALELFDLFYAKDEDREGEADDADAPE